jgi:hypothetical protein
MDSAVGTHSAIFVHYNRSTMSNAQTWPENVWVNSEAQFYTVNAKTPTRESSICDELAPTVAINDEFRLSEQSLKVQDRVTPPIPRVPFSKPVHPQVFG